MVNFSEKTYGVALEMDIEAMNVTVEAVRNVLTAKCKFFTGESGDMKVTITRQSNHGLLPIYEHWATV